MTVIERLRASGAAEKEAQEAATTIAAALPIGHPVTIDDEVLRAARDGDLVSLQLYFAEEDAATPDELAALEDLEREPDRETLSAADVHARLGL